MSALVYFLFFLLYHTIVLFFFFPFRGLKNGLDQTHNLFP